MCNLPKEISVGGNEMSLIIGLTGGIASGKSTVSAMFMKLDIPVIDADKIAREIVEPGEQAYLEIVQVFGEGILNDDHTLNRKKLGSIVFSDEEKRNQLNQMLHPMIRSEMDEQKETYINAGKKCIVLDIPLLFENELKDIVDQTIVAYVDEEVQLERLMARNHFIKEEAERRIKSQLSLSDKVKLADAVIDNNGSKIETNRQLIKILQNWQVI